MNRPPRRARLVPPRRAYVAAAVRPFEAAARMRRGRFLSDEGRAAVSLGLLGLVGIVEVAALIVRHLR